MIPRGGADADDVAPYDVPRGTCPSCGSGAVRHLRIGLVVAREDATETPPWVDWVGCVHPGYDRQCEPCGLTWSADGTGEDVERH